MWQEILSASGLLAMLVAMLFERNQRGGLFGLLTLMVNRRSAITLERARAKNLRHVLNQLPAGGQIMEQSSEPGHLHIIRIVTRGQPDQRSAP